MNGGRKAHIYGVSVFGRKHSHQQHPNSFAFLQSFSQQTISQSLFAIHTLLLQSTLSLLSMHVKTSVLHLATVISLFPFLGLSAAPYEIIVGTTATALKPINIHDFEAATGVRRRAADDFSHLDPNIQAQLIYGRPGSKYPLTLERALGLARLHHPSMGVVKRQKTAS